MERETLSSVGGSVNRTHLDILQDKKDANFLQLVYGRRLIQCNRNGFRD
jgi:hypothetical protein